MILIEKLEVFGFEHAIRGMRNPMNSWGKSDSGVNGYSESAGVYPDTYTVGPNDKNLMMKLVKGGPIHAKFRRMISVYMDITAPLYWWKEFDTYKVGTVTNSCSTMHKIHDKEFTLEDFSHEHLISDWRGNNVAAFIFEENNDNIPISWSPFDVLELTIKGLNASRESYLKTKDKKYWWNMIQLLPSSYNQKRTVMLNYEVLSNIYDSRKDHKLDEWKTFCNEIEQRLPYSFIFVGPDKKYNTF